MLIGTLIAAGAVPLYRWLYQAAGPRGLALASSLGVLTNATATVLVYRFRQGTLPLRPIGLGVARGLLFAVVGGMAA